MNRLIIYAIISVVAFITLLCAFLLPQPSTVISFVVLTSKINFSCQGRCIDFHDPTMLCQCDPKCPSQGDCCPDYQKICIENLSCRNRCNVKYSVEFPCQCNYMCELAKNCCDDYSQYCFSGNISDDEILTVSSKAWSADDQRIGIELDFGINATKFCRNISNDIYVKSQYIALQELYPYYERNTSVNESNDLLRDQQINLFISNVTSTKTMAVVQAFLASKGVVPKDIKGFKTQLNAVWFGFYKRNGALSSSGAEHVLIGEVSGDTVKGLHSWVRYCTEEKGGNITFLEMKNNTFLGNSVYLSAISFKWDGALKSLDSMFFGTSPAFDLAVFTLCFYARPNTNCTIKLNDALVPIRTRIMNYNDNVYVETAYPIN
ncbi:hypothetical protein CHUAL_009649 [Chamberlinius hualienensis]